MNQVNHRRLDGTIALNYYRVRLTYSVGPNILGYSSTLQGARDMKAVYEGDAEISIEQQREHENGLCHWEALDDEEV